jgi:hypothetical protein
VPINSAETRNKGYALVEFGVADEAHLFKESMDQSMVEGRKI